MSDTLNTIPTMTETNGSFSESNSLVAKFSFLLLIIFMFILLLNVGISLIAWLVKPSPSPKLINGMIDATQMVTFAQDPSSNGSATIYRSNNATDGIEFTWSVWILINNLQYLEGQYKHVFYKGNNNLESNGLNCQNNKLDVYINGTITRSVQLMGVPKQNYGDVFVAANGGFNGYISNLWYYNYALGTSEISNISMKGPNTTLTNSSSINTTMKDPNYLSLRWYFYGSGDSYNPV